MESTVLQTDLKKLTEDVNKLLTIKQARDEDCGSDEIAITRLSEILAKGAEQYDEKVYEEKSNAVKRFMESGEVQRNKLLAYCVDFYDPTVAEGTRPDLLSVNNVSALGETVLNCFVNDDAELNKAYEFVMRHSRDKSFGETVYKIMDKHNITAPEVYKAAYLRRQDFSRATDVKSQSVTKRMVWQIIMGIKCTLEEANLLLFSAGYVLNESKLDLTMRYFIKNGVYDILTVNYVLDDLHLKAFPCYSEVRDRDNL